MNGQRPHWLDDPKAPLHTILGVSESPTHEELRAAYLRRLTEFPPDRQPEAFQRVREAYELMKDPYARFEALLRSADPTRSPMELLSGHKKLHFVDKQLWLEALKPK
ncbi:MAG: DnaJ domain-containing protein [Sumerlaeia bacterium]